MTANEPDMTNKNSDFLWETVSEVVDQLQYFVDQADDKAASSAELIQKLLEVECLPGISREELSIVYCEYGTQDYKLIVYAGEEIKDGLTPEGTFASDNQFIKDVAINSMKADEYPWFKTKTECKDAGFTGFGTVMIIPMRLGRDRRLGAFIIHNKKENAYDKRLQRVLDVLSDRLAALIRSLRRRLRDELTYELRNKLLEQLTSNDEKRMFHGECEILDKVLKHLRQWYEHDRIHILIKNPLDIDNYFLATDEQSENIRAGFRSTQVLDEKSLYQIVGGKDNLEVMKAPPSVDVSTKDNQSVASRGAIRNPSKLPNIHEECQSWLGVTMHHPDGYVFGHIVLHDTGMPHAYDNDDLRFMDALADFLGFFLVEFRTKKKKAVIQKLTATSLDKTQELYTTAADYLELFYGVKHFQIWTVNFSSHEWELVWPTKTNKHGITPTMDDSVQNEITRFAIKHRARPGYGSDPLELSLGGQNHLVTPMRTGSSAERIIGAFVIPADHPGKVASYVIDEVSDALGDRLNSLHRQHRYEALTTFVNEVSSLPSTDLTQEKVLGIAYQHISKVMFSGNMYIALYDGAKDTISFPLIYRKGEVWKEMHNQERKINPTQLGRTEVIIRDKKPLLIKTKDESEAWYKQLNHKEHAGNPLASWVGVPIFAASEGKRQTVRGVIAAYHDDLDYVYSIRDVFFLQNVAGSVSGLFRLLENQDLKETNRKLEEAIANNTELKEANQKLGEALDLIEKQEELGSKEVSRYIEKNIEDDLRILDEILIYSGDDIKKAKDRNNIDWLKDTDKLQNKAQNIVLQLKESLQSIKSNIAHKNNRIYMDIVFKELLISSLDKNSIKNIKFRERGEETRKISVYINEKYLKRSLGIIISIIAKFANKEKILLEYKAEKHESNTIFTIKITSGEIKNDLSLAELNDARKIINLQLNGDFEWTVHENPEGQQQITIQISVPTEQLNVALLFSEDNILWKRKVMNCLSNLNDIDIIDINSTNEISGVGKINNIILDSDLIEKIDIKNRLNKVHVVIFTENIRSLDDKKPILNDYLILDRNEITEDKLKQVLGF